jgi:hypothetical protein
VRALIAQRFSLSQALTHFRGLDVEWSDAEENYQYILALTKKFLRDRPEEGAEVLGRLEKDYQQLRADRNTPSVTPTKTTEPSR